jgi:NADH:ubiquinone oxidoreductase subunit 6 (subunit J)
MLFSYLFFYTFACFGILSSFMIVVTKNPIFSVLFLIITFFNVSSLLLLIEIDFLPIVFLIVYVGAVAILFLFVLMMLNIKISELKENTNHFIPIAMFLFVIFFFELFAVFYFEFTVLNFQKVHVEILDELCLFLNSSFEFHS